MRNCQLADIPGHILAPLRYAAHAHERAGDRYGDHAYSVHLLDVVGVLMEFGEDRREVLIAAPLHDVIEDTDVARAELADLFGPGVAALVDAVSDPEGYPDRKARKAASYPRIAAVPGAVALKLADRIANVRACLQQVEAAPDRKARKRGKSLLKMYQREHAGFSAALRDDAEPAPPEAAMWGELDRLLG